MHFPKGLDDELVLELEKALYGLKQAGRMWNKLLHTTLVEIDFGQSLADVCVYFGRQEGVPLVGVYADLLITGTQQDAVDAFFSELTVLSIKDLGPASKLLGMRVSYSEEEGYYMDQEVAILTY
ncbi:hypothetical protein PF003_g257 [Phytophthora fragariae]|nr:hypothetical protein PF003_g257 [Phytophthora fragariae]